MIITFDTSLPLFAALVAREWGRDALDTNLFLRDGAGRLTFVVLDTGRSSEERESLSQKVNAALFHYVDSSGISVATPDELFDDSLAEAGASAPFPVSTLEFTGFVNLLDRRVVGADWLRKPASTNVVPPRLFFVSLKGGVGRSTALCVLAAHLANQGRRVLAVDLDLEAPGIGTMLLNPESVPKFGALDYFVESSLSQIDENFLMDMIGPSPLSGGRGIISVIPAFGQTSVDHPENVLGKIARAYLATDNGAGEIGFAAKAESLLAGLSKLDQFDVVLIDARAGLHESTAASTVGLGGETLIFGIDQPQTYAGYKALFAQLAATLGSEWSSKLHFVEAKADPSADSLDFSDKIVAAFPQERDEKQVLLELSQFRNVFETVWEDDATFSSEVDLDYRLEVSSTYIYESSYFSRFDPLSRPDRLESSIYSAVYGDFLNLCISIIQRLESDNAALEIRGLQ